MLKKIAKRRDKDASGNHGLSGSSAKLDARARTSASLPHVSFLVPLLLLSPLALLGEWLIERTHHRPLGAATFASCTILLWIGLEALIRILFSARELRPQKVLRMKRILSAVGVAGSLGVFVRALF